MDDDSKKLLNEIQGKTVQSVDHGESYLTIHFTDGSTVSIASQGSDEGSWLSVSDS